MHVEADQSFLRLPAVLQRVSFSKSSLYSMVADHRFPAPYRLSERVSAWKKSDVDQWCSARTQTPPQVRPKALKREERAKRAGSSATQAQ